MGLIVSNKKYKAALGEIERLKKERTEMRKIIVSKDIEINGLDVYKRQYLFSTPNINLN